MSNIVDFPNGRPPAADNRAGRTEAEAQLAATRTATLRRVRANLAAFPRMSRPSDRAVLARNLWSLLDRIERERGVPKARVLQGAGQAGPGDSTKRLPRFALRPDLPEDEAKRRASALTQTVAKYVRITEAAASLAGENLDELLLELTAGSRFVAENAQAASSTTAPHFEEIADLLNAMANAIAVKYDLHNYFKFISDNAIVYDANEEELYVNDLTERRISHLVDGGVVFNDDEKSVFPFIPKVFIGEFVINEKLNAEYAFNLKPDEELELEVDRSVPGFGVVKDAHEKCPIKHPKITSARVCITSDIWICLAPLGRKGEVLPAFMEKRRFNLRVGVGFHSLVAEPGEPPVGKWVLSNRMDDDYLKINVKDAFKIFDAFSNAAPYPIWGDKHSFSGEEQDWRSLKTVTPVSCSSLLGRKGALQLTEDIDNESNDGYAQSDSYDVTNVGDAPGTTLVGAIEQNLCFAEDDYSIERRLARAVERRVGALNAFRREAEKEITRRKSELLERWEQGKIKS